MEMYVPKSLYTSKLFLFEFAPWQLHLEQKDFEKSDILQMLEDSTDSELSSGSLFHSDESNSDSDSENLGDNPETVDDIPDRGANENIITGTWSNEINFDELEEHENLAGPNHNLPYGSSEKDFFQFICR
jgi:hypothetical protein